MTEKLEAIVEELREADRQERAELLIDLAKGLPPLPDRLASGRDEAHRVPECVAPVFLFAERGEGDRLRLFADVPMEALTVRGFVALLVEGLDGASAGEVREVPNDLVERTGIIELIGMQRASGLPSILRRLKMTAARAAAEAPAIR